MRLSVGTIKAQQFYGSTKAIKDNYMIDLENDPHLHAGRQEENYVGPRTGQHAQETVYEH